MSSLLQARKEELVQKGSALLGQCRQTAPRTAMGYQRFEYLGRTGTEGLPGLGRGERRGKDQQVLQQPVEESIERRCSRQKPGEERGDKGEMIPVKLGEKGRPGDKQRIRVRIELAECVTKSQNMSLHRGKRGGQRGDRRRRRQNRRALLPG